MNKMEEPLAREAVSPSQETPSLLPAPRLGLRERIFLAAACVSAGAYFFLHPFLTGTRHWHMPGIGLTVTQWLIVAVALAAARRGKRLRLKGRAGGVFLLAVSLGLGACYGVFANDSLRLMNLPVTLLTGALALFSLTGCLEENPLTAQGLCGGARLVLPACFRNWGVLFRALAARKYQKEKGKLSGLGMGLFWSVPAAVIALALLASADGVFENLLGRGLRSVEGIDGAFFLRLALTLLGTMLLFSFLYTTGRDTPIQTEKREKSANPVTFATVLAALAAIYALFVYVQFRYLFGGAETVRLAGGYAEYARSGFFQLVILSILTLALILPALILCARSKAVRSLCGILAALTIVIDISAFFRMQKYISAYGLTLLRVVTLWGIAMILLALLAVIVKCFSPALRVCPLLTTVALASWLALNCSNVDLRIAQYQVTVHAREQTPDLAYLCSLSPDVLPALEQIQDPSQRREAQKKAREAFLLARPQSYDWSLSWLKID